MRSRLTDRQIERFLNGECSEEEYKAILQIAEENPAYQYLKQQWDETGYDEPVDKKQSLKMLNHIRRQTGLRKKYLQWVAAAACIIGVAVVALFYTGKDSNRGVPVAAIKNATPKVETSWKYLNNNSNNVMHYILPDSSVVKLYAGASLRYKDDLNQALERRIYLKGKAFFEVFKSADKPFTVYTGVISTTAMGTSFTIIEGGGDFLIELHTGKVKLSKEADILEGWNRDIVMSPGQRMQYQAEDKMCKVIDTQKDNGTASKKNMIKRNAAPVELTFSNAALTVVMDSLARKYKTDIRYNPSEINGRHFSGSVSTTDSLHKVLKLITLLNDLEMHFDQQSGYSITIKQE